MEVNFKSTDGRVEIGIKGIKNADNYYEIPIEDLTNKLKTPFQKWGQRLFFIKKMKLAL